MRVVSENSEADLERKRAIEATKRAMDDVSTALVQLTANLMRVTRGAGKSYELGAQAQRFVDALVAHREVAGRYPDAYSLDTALWLDRDEEFLNRLSEESREEYHAKQSVLRGALQIVASQMLGQLTIQRSGEEEMYAGMRRIEEIRENNRKQREAEWRAASQKPAPKKPKPKL